MLKLIPPGSIGFLVVCSVIGIALMLFARRARRAIRIALALLYGGYLVLAVPRVADWIAARLPPIRSIEPIPSAAFDAVIVLDGDNRRGRVRAVRQLEEGPSPPPVIVLADAGDPWVVDNLVGSGVRRDRITSEQGADTTREQVDRARTTVAARAWRRVALVASRLQAPRLSALTNRWQPQPAIIAAPVDDEPAESGIWAFVPSYIALRVSRDALYEHTALMYYRWRGWI